MEMYSESINKNCMETVLLIEDDKNVVNITRTYGSVI